MTFRRMEVGATHGNIVPGGGHRASLSVRLVRQCPVLRANEFTGLVEQADIQPLTVVSGRPGARQVRRPQAPDHYAVGRGFHPVRRAARMIASSVFAVPGCVAPSVPGQGPKCLF